MQFTWDWNWVIGPLVGAIIGLITNGIAIRMLFRPLHAVKIGNFTLPFTPGLIPKERPRIAHSIGLVVADKLVNAEVLEGGMLNPEIDKKISDFIDSFLGRFKNDDETVEQLLIKYFGEESVAYYVGISETKLAEMIYQKLVELNLGNVAMDAVYKEFERKDQQDPGSVNFFPLLVGLMEGKIVDLINDTVEKQGFFIVNDFVTQQGSELINMKLSEVYTKFEKYIPALKENVLKAYHFTVKNYLPGMLQEINLAKLVEDKINEFSLIELEKLLLDLMRKELNAIVYLGGLLGAIMGVVMIFV